MSQHEACESQTSGQHNGQQTENEGISAEDMSQHGARAGQQFGEGEKVLNKQKHEHSGMKEDESNLVSKHDEGSTEGEPHGEVVQGDVG